ncbi:Ldh family oxidoreductase [Subtercola lobariae]|uniref:Sulfolactate dehydrogenase n=1 Tax=Subtercola lobariae TaxID=1588641 RepID=A0A917BA13_9MICO|nr:Ldh family oxidoreductase [Subtercola lobariae]GGF33764.1 sulfolactate dehydrogenase [Subtercola lobariae]
MILTITEAQRLVEQSMESVGHTEAEARIIADHLIDCELRGLAFGGVARALSIIERITSTPTPPSPIALTRETFVSAQFDGGDQVGYLVADRATDAAIEKARTMGIAVVGANNTWYTGMFSYYLERITAAGFMGIIAGSGAHIVAPHGGTEARFGTNPIAFGFPSTTGPIIWDVGTASVMLGEILVAMRLGQPIAEGLGYDREGEPTVNPQAALSGAFTVWGGHKGSGLALVVQLLGMMTGAAAAPVGISDCGFFVLAVDPELFGSADDFQARVAEYAESIRSTRPVDAQTPVRVPFDRSIAERSRRQAEGTLNILDPVYVELQRISQGAAVEAKSENPQDTINRLINER